MFSEKAGTRKTQGRYEHQTNRGHQVLFFVCRHRMSFSRKQWGYRGHSCKARVAYRDVHQCPMRPMRTAAPPAGTPCHAASSGPQGSVVPEERKGRPWVGWLRNARRCTLGCKAFRARHEGEWTKTPSWL